MRRLLPTQAGDKPPRYILPSPALDFGLCREGKVRGRRGFTDSAPGAHVEFLVGVFGH